MDRSRLYEWVDRAWEPLLAALDGLPDRIREEPGDLGSGWSVADLMGHIATWEEETMAALALMLQGKRPPRYGDIDAFNARTVAAKQGMSAVQARRHLLETHERLLRFLAALPEERYAREGSFRRRLRLDTTSHYREHTAQLLTWRRARGL